MGLRDETVELLSGYDRWRKEQLAKDPGHGPKEYADYLQTQERERAYREMAELAASTAERLRVLLDPPPNITLDEEFKATLTDALTVAEAVVVTG